MNKVKIWDGKVFRSGEQRCITFFYGQDFHDPAGIIGMMELDAAGNEHWFANNWRIRLLKWLVSWLLPGEINA